MPLVKQAVQVDLRGTDQHTGAKRLAPGRSPLMQNVRQRYGRGIYGKRYGCSPLAVGLGNYGLGLVTAAGALTGRTFDGVSVWDAVRSTWRDRGQVSRAVVTSGPAISQAAYAWKPSSITAGGYTYFFAGVAPTTAPAANSYIQTVSWVYRVVDAVSGAEIVPVTAINGPVGFQAKPVVAGGGVWLFVGTDLIGGGQRALTVIKFDPTNPTNAPTTTTYQDVGVGHFLVGWDVMQTHVGGAVVAVLDQNTVGGTTALSVSSLNTSTGLASGTISTSNVQFSSTSGTQSYNVQFAKVANPDSNGKYWILGRSNAATSWWGVTITASTLAVATGPVGLATLGTASTAVASLFAGTPVVYYATPGATPSTSTISKATFNASWGLSGSFTTIRRHMNILGEPIQVTTVPGLTTELLPVQYDDADVASPSAQRCYALLGGTLLGTVFGRALYGSAGDTYQHGYVGSITNADQAWVAPTSVTGDYSVATSVVQFAANGWDGAFFSTKVARFDFTKTLASGFGPPVPTMLGQAAVLPGGWPSLIVGAARAVEWPGLFPPQISVSVTTPGGGPFPPSGVYSLAVVYAYRDRITGATIRSAPSPTVTTPSLNGTTNAMQITVPCLGLTSTAAGDLWVELYCSTAGQTTMFRQVMAPNDPTTDVVINLGGSATGAVPLVSGTEQLYTQNSDLANDPPPPCAVAATWRNRVFVADAENPGDVWPSKEIVSGHGPEFSGGLLFSLPGGTGPVTAMSPLDHNWFLIFQADSIWAIQGDGPDVTGRGAYEPVRLSGNFGATSPGSVVSTIRGVYFQNTDGRICLVDGGLQVHDDAADGAWGYTASAVTAAVDFPAKKQLHFYLGAAAADGTFRLVLDYANVSPDNLAGEWYADSQPADATMLGDGGACAWNGLPAFCHAAVQAPVRTEVQGQFFDGTTTPILRKVQLPLVLSGVRGYQRLYRGQIVGQFKTAHSLKVTVDTFDGVAGEAGSATETWTTSVSTGPELFEFRPTRGRLSAFTVTVEDTGTDRTEGGTLDGIAFVVGVKQGLPRVGSGQRL